MRGTLLLVAALTSVVIAALADDASACGRRRGSCGPSYSCGPAYYSYSCAPYYGGYGTPYYPGGMPGAMPTVATTWKGSEDLKGYGELSFQLYPGGRAVVVDVKGTFPGTWSQSGNQVIIDQTGFARYTGTISGNVLSGQGQDATRTWNFNVTKAD